MILVRVWTACFPFWLTDDLSYYLGVRFVGDRAIDSFGHDSPFWAYQMHPWEYGHGIAR